MFKASIAVHSVGLPVYKIDHSSRWGCGNTILWCRMANPRGTSSVANVSRYLALRNCNEELGKDAIPVAIRGSIYVRGKGPSALLTTMERVWSRTVRFKKLGHCAPGPGTRPHRVRKSTNWINLYAADWQAMRLFHFGRAARMLGSQSWNPWLTSE